MRKINLAILGSGFMSKVYLRAADCLKHYYPDSPIVRVKSLLVSKRTTQEEIDKIRKRYNIEIITKEYKDILSDDEIDAIYIATPNNFHHEQACSAIKNSKHVLCEKPISKTLMEAEEMLTCSNQNPNIIANMVFEYRYIPSIIKIKKIIDSQQIGDIIQFRAVYLHGSYIIERPLTWRLQKGTGGAFVDLSPHLFDLISFLIGEIKVSNIKAEKKMPNRRVDDVAWASCQAKNAHGTIEVSRVSTGTVDELRLEIHGTKGAIKWNLEELNYFYMFLTSEKESGFKKIPHFTNLDDSSDFPPPKVTSGWLDSHIHCLYHFVKKISDKEYLNDYIARFEDGYNVQKILEKLK